MPEVGPEVDVSDHRPNASTPPVPAVNEGGLDPVDKLVNAPVFGVVPPIGPGFGRAVVEPPSATEVPPIVMAELLSPALGIPVMFAPLNVGAS